MAEKISEKKDVKTRTLANLEIRDDEGLLVVSVNPKIYPLNIIYSAAYVFIDKAFVIIDGDPMEEIVVEIRPKDKTQDLEQMGRDFNNELLSYAVYEVQSLKNAPLREAIVKRAMLVGEYAKEPEKGVEESGKKHEKDTGGQKQ